MKEIRRSEIDDRAWIIERVGESSRALEDA